MKHVLLVGLIILTIVALAACRPRAISDVTTISQNKDSNYVQTFKDLNLGAIFDFNFKSAKANKRWVTLWVDGYVNGKKQAKPLVTLTYGLSPNKVDQEHLGLGLMTSDSSDPKLILFASGVTSTAIIDHSLFLSSGLSQSSYAISDKNNELQVGKTMILASYRQSKSGLEGIDYQDPQDVENMIQHDHTVLLLKVRVADKKPQN